MLLKEYTKNLKKHGKFRRRISQSIDILISNIPKVIQ